MKKVLLFLLPVVLAILVFGVVTFFLARSNPGKGAIQVTAAPESNVFLNGKPIGKTPLCKCDPSQMLLAGDYTVRVVPLDTKYLPYEDKVTINPSVLTAVDRTFGDVGKSSGSVIMLTQVSGKNAQLFISSFPDTVKVTLDNNSVGVTPLLLQTITSSDHEIVLEKDGYQSKTVRVHGVDGYKLSVQATLATDETAITATPTPSASPSAIPNQQVKILDTPTGFLRVRSTPSLGGDEVGQVHPGETYPFVTDQDGWIEITLQNGKNGWVSSSYATKQ